MGPAIVPVHEHCMLGGDVLLRMHYASLLVLQYVLHSSAICMFDAYINFNPGVVLVICFYAIRRWDAVTTASLLVMCQARPQAVSRAEPSPKKPSRAGPQGSASRGSRPGLLFWEAEAEL